MFVNNFFFGAQFPLKLYLIEILKFYWLKKGLMAHREMVRDKINAGDMQY